MEIVDKPIDITVVVNYLAEDSAPEDNYYLFEYQISLFNKSDKDIILLSRQWTVTDGNGHKKESKSKGVAGEQPCIKIGEVFKYTGRANISTPVGSIYGKYVMQVEAGELYETLVLPFRLVVPGALH